MNDKESDQVQLCLAASSLVVGFTSIGVVLHHNVMIGFSIGLAAALGMSGLLYRFWYAPRAMSYARDHFHKGKAAQ